MGGKSLGSFWASVMPEDRPGEVTVLLEAIRAGDDEARLRLIEQVYASLHGLAEGLMRGERHEHTLQPTALLHEAFVRLFDTDVLARAPNRAYLYGAAARAMREVLVNHANRRSTAKRGGDWQRVPLDDVLDWFEEQRVDVVAVHEALERLEQFHERQSQVVTLRFFAGCTVAEVADRLGVAVSTVESDYRIARAWLRHQLGEDEQ
jgi:RNA polymerase sigma factor (TIGR02999 family)